jgi:hypothetical protein
MQDVAKFGNRFAHAKIQCSHSVGLSLYRVKSRMSREYNVSSAFLGSQAGLGLAWVPGQVPYPGSRQSPDQFSAMLGI